MEHQANHHQSTLTNQDYMKVIDKLLDSRLAQYLQIRFHLDDFIIVLIHLFLLIIGLYLILSIHLVWLLIAICYPTVKSFRAKDYQQTIWMYYFLVIAVMMNLDPIFDYLINSIFPIYGIARTAFILWLQSNDAEGMKSIVELLKKRNFDGKKFQQEVVDVLDKVSARNF